MSERAVDLHVLRYNPETDKEPRWQQYAVPYNEEWVVLDALNYVKAHLDPTLSYRWSCHMAVCGSCGMMVNGEPKLSCKAFLRDLPATIRVEPLAHFPIERDLVTVVEDFMGKLARVKPYLIPKEAEAGRRRRVPADAGGAEALQAVRAVHQLHAVLRRVPRVRPDSEVHRPGRDRARPSLQPSIRATAAGNARQEEIAADEGVWECTFVGACSQVCPKHVDPAAALQQVKIASTMDWYQEHLMPWLNK